MPNKSLIGSSIPRKGPSTKLQKALEGQYKIKETD